MGICDCRKKTPPEKKIMIDYLKLEQQFKNYINEEKIQDFLDKKYNKEDKVFNSIRAEEKEDLTKFYYSNKAILLGDIDNYLKEQNINFINNLTKQIITYENGRKIYEDNIREEINKLYNEEKLCEINHLTVMVVGVTGAGKSTLINAMLDEDLAGEFIGEIGTKEIAVYGNTKVPFLHLVDSRGYELSDQFKPDAIGTDICEYINTVYEKNKNGNPCNFVNCIWFCIKDNRFQKKEEKLYDNINNTLKQFGIPIIVVRTFAIDNKIDQGMKAFLESRNLDVKNNFVRVISKDLEKVKAFGKDELMKLTLKKYKASNGYFKKFVINKIQNYIIDNIAKNNYQNIKLIRNDIMREIIYEDKAADDFENYIIDIYRSNTNFFFGQTLNNKSISLIENCEFNNHKKNFLLYCKNREDEFIKNFIEGFAFKFLDIQAKRQKEMKKVIQLENIRTYDDFILSGEKFLTDNYNYISQKKYIEFFIEKICLELSQSFQVNLDNITKELMSKKEIQSQILNCYEKKFTDLEERIKHSHVFIFENYSDFDNSPYFKNKQINSSSPPPYYISRNVNNNE